MHHRMRFWPAIHALSFLMAATAPADVFVVRARPGAALSVEASLSTKAVGEKFCKPLHCIVTTRVPLETAALNALRVAGAVELEPLPDAHKVMFANAIFDGDAGTYSKDFPGKAELPTTGSSALYAVMFKALPEAEWLNEIIALGGVPVAFMPSMSYLVYGPRSLKAKLASKDYVFRVEEAPAGIKRSGLDDAGMGGSDEIQTLVSIVNVSSSNVKDRISKSHGGTPPSARKDGFLETLEARMTHSEALALSRLPEVMFIARSREAKPSDERSNRIIAGGQPGSGSGSWPPAIGTNLGFWSTYLANLSTIPTFNLSNQVIGFLDTGVDAGMKGCGDRCPPYLRANASDTCRLVYTNDVTSDFSSYGIQGGDPASNRRATDYDYHGTLTTSIAAGFAGSESSGVDTNGYAFTQGVAQGARVAMSKIFAPACDPNANATFWRTFGDVEGQFAPSKLNQLIRYSFVALTRQTPLPDGSPAGPGARLFNHSWNASTAGYDDVAATMDTASLSGLSFTFLYSDGHQEALSSGYPMVRPSLHIVAAGNCAPSPCNPAVDSVLSPATAKNVIAVGATYSDNHQPFMPLCAACNELAPGTDYRTVSPWSRSGNLGGRIKPDLVAPGVRSYGRRSSSIFYCASDGCNSSLGNYPGPANSYKWSTGTSFAAPVVTGAAVVVSEWLDALVRNGSVDSTYWPPDSYGVVYPTPSLIKAILIGGAKDLCPTDSCPIPKLNSSDPDRLMRSAPDRFQGWGGVSLERLFGAASSYFLGNRMTIRGLGVWSKTLSVVDGSRPITVSLVWPDPTSAVGPLVDNVLVADLDLTVSFTGRDGVARTYYGNLYGTPSNPLVRDGYSLPNPSAPTFDRAVNNVERVSIRVAEAPAAGSSLTVTVTPFTLGPPACDPTGYSCVQRAFQDFSLFADNAH